MELIMLGTGHATVTKCYNTCFVLRDEDACFLVDAGGGNGILSQLSKAGISWKNIHHLFLTHKHIDHLTGAIWLLRVVSQSIKNKEYTGDFYIYGHAEVIEILQSIANMVLQANVLNAAKEQIHFVVVEDGEEKEIIGHPVQFFDIHSTKAKQFGFTFAYGDGQKLVCCGDEPYNEFEAPYTKDATFLMHEAFCLFAQADIFHPYEKHHSTAKDACEIAQKLEVPNLILYHTEDKNLERRKELYSKEGTPFYQGNLYIPDDLETIIL